MWPPGNVSAITLHGGLSLGSYIVALLASLGLYVRWRMSGEAHTGLLAAAFAVVSAPPLLLWVLPLGTHVQDFIQGSQQPTHLVSLLPSAVLLARSARAPQVDTALNPVGLSVVYGAVATALIVGLSLAREHDRLPFGEISSVTADVVTAALCLALAIVFARFAPSFNAVMASRLAGAFLVMSVPAVLTALARLLWAPLWVVAGWVSCLAMGLLLLLALALVHNVMNFTGDRLATLGLRADSAEETVRLEQERLHELRATVAGIRGACSLLTRHEQRLDRPRTELLQQMVSAELARLERLVSPDGGKSVAPEETNLDEVIRPLVVRHRHTGMTISWRPSSVSAFYRRDEVAEIVNVLLTNAHRHAHGAAVWVDVEALRDVVRVFVEDGGPGVEPELAESMFDRGSRRRDSPGDGLGLHIAHRLAADQGGDLRRAEPAHGSGACFVLTLRRQPPADESVSTDAGPLEDAV
jgi:signal transduction histidine kinase